MSQQTPTDPAQAIRKFNRGRDPERLALKFAKMRASPFAFLRGSNHLFYRRLPKDAVLEESPKVWVCGDLHLENFGSYKGDNRLAYFDINDFDDAALAPCTWDLVRLLASAHLGMESLKLSPSEITGLTTVLIDSYAASLATGKARWVERDTSEGLVARLLHDTADRSRPNFLDTRTLRKGKRRKIRTDNGKALPATAEQRDRVTAFMESFAAGREDEAFFQVLDVARRIAGTGSLGVDRYVILVRGRGSPDGNFLLDLKEAQPSPLAPRLGVKQPKWPSEAHRVVAIQHRVQAVSVAFLQPVSMARRAYVLRALQPSEDRIDLRQWDGKPTLLQGLMATMGAIVAWGHLRAGGRDGSAIADELIAFAAKTRWRKQIGRLGEECAEQTRQDWLAFAQAYDGGYFANMVGEEPTPP